MKNKTYDQKVKALEAQGITTSDAQGIVDAEILKGERAMKNNKPKHTPLDRLKHHVTGAIERGEAVAIEAVVAPKHTPGPWHYDDEFQEVRTNGTLKDSGKDICSFNFADFDTSEDTANAVLCAAAPEMLEALELLVESFPELQTDEALSGADVVEHLANNWEVFTKAIAKAKGVSRGK